IVSGGHYCARCNGSVELSVPAAAVGRAEGGRGVGRMIRKRGRVDPYCGDLPFAGRATADGAVPARGTSWGGSAPERIERIHFGLSMGGSTQAGSFGIDDLIVGDGTDLTPCGDGIPTPDEECDDAGESAACDANCTLAVCGDGTFNMLAGEA